MITQIPFQYVDFHDFPRVVLIRLTEGELYLSAPFSEALDEYPDEFEAWWLPTQPPPKPGMPWGDLATQGNARKLGSIKCTDLVFDPTRRQSLLWSSIPEMIRNLIPPPA